MNLKFISGMILLNISSYFLLLSILQFYYLTDVFSQLIIPGILVFDYFVNGSIAIVLLMAGIYLWMVSK